MTPPRPQPPKQPEFALRLRSVPHDVPVAVRLRRLLKCLLRVYGFRCVTIRQIDPDWPEHGL